MTPMLKWLYREAELQRRFMRFGDIKLARIAAKAIFNEYEKFLLIRMRIDI